MGLHQFLLPSLPNGASYLIAFPAKRYVASAHSQNFHGQQVLVSTCTTKYQLPVYDMTLFMICRLIIIERTVSLVHTKFPSLIYEL